MKTTTPPPPPAPREAIEALVTATLRRSGFAAAEIDDGTRNALLAMFQLVLQHHQSTFAVARKPADFDSVAAALARGEFAEGRPRPDVDLWHDIALAALVARNDETAVGCFRRRFTARVAAWQNRYARGTSYECDEFLADLLLPRERSGPRIESYAGHGPFDGWLQQVYMSLCHKRREQGHAHRETRSGRVAEDGDDAWSEVAADAVAPDERFARLECAEKLAPLIRESLNVLDPASRTVLLLAVVDEVPQKNIAELYGLREYKVTRLKQTAISKVSAAFRALADRAAGMSAESARECLDLLLERFPAV